MAQNKFKHRINNSNINIDYMSKDFISLKRDLVSYAKTYFPDTYTDFNETSPGMMIMEMSAYVGDILSYYIDHQFKESTLPLSEERRNIINLASMLGYKTKPIVPAIVEIQFRQTIDHDPGQGDDPRVPDYGDLMTFNSGVRVKSSTNSNVFFETLDVLDFSVTGSFDDQLIPIGQDTYGLTNLWEIKRKVKSVSGQTKVMTFDISNPKQFLELKIPENNVINIESVTDSNGRSWYEVEYLAQDRILTGAKRGNGSIYDGTNIPTQYSLNPNFTTDRRFIIKVNFDNTTSLVFGNGKMAEKYSASQINNIWQENEDINALIQGTLPSSISPLQTSDYNQTLGETPAHTTLTVAYRVGGGIKSNVPSNDLLSITNASSKATGDTTKIDTLSCTNLEPARGGKDSEDIEDIRHKASSFFAAQGRTVTAGDYESRILAMPASYGNVAKVFVNRRDFNEVTGSTGDVSGQEIFSSFDFDGDGSIYGGSSDSASFATALDGLAGAATSLEASGDKDKFDALGNLIGSLGSVFAGDMLSFLNLNAFVLSYDQNKNLVKSTDIIKVNIKNYLGQYKVLSDEVYIRDGVVINFGVKFTIEAHNNINKSELKIKCIEEIINYFKNDFMEFNQIIYTSDLENTLYSNVEGIKVIHDLFLTQDGADLNISNHLHALVSDGTGVVENGVPADGVSGPISSAYGHAYITNFKQAYGVSPIAGNGVILPPEASETPGVFELKNPRDNVRGVII